LSHAVHYRGRFAPSPTGPLHFGSLIAALASYVDARAHRGEWCLRIDDIDEPRSRSEAESDILATLERYGFEWDGPIVRQSSRIERYAAALASLRDKRAVYACACTRRDLESAPIGCGGERVYPGTCRDGIPGDRAIRDDRAWRVRVDHVSIRFHDRLQGAQQQDLAHDIGDFIVRRADGLFAYQLAVVVDDADGGITHVVRGSDLLASTPRQIFLQRELGYPEPRYLHVPIALNASGEKLSKQTRAKPLPRDPLAALIAAWRFLDQPLPSPMPSSVAEFLRYAIGAWTPARLPPVSMLPAPAAFERPGPSLRDSV
jgi:glutamyl-Q tRNA(Asp) synthetase